MPNENGETLFIEIFSHCIMQQNRMPIVRGREQYSKLRKQPDKYDILKIARWLLSRTLGNLRTNLLMKLLIQFM